MFSVTIQPRPYIKVEVRAFEGRRESQGCEKRVIEKNKDRCHMLLDVRNQPSTVNVIRVCMQDLEEQGILSMWKKGTQWTGNSRG